MEFVIDYYYLDRNRDYRYYTLEEAKAAAEEWAKENKYYPVINFAATINSLEGYVRHLDEAEVE